MASQADACRAATWRHFDEGQKYNATFSFAKVTKVNVQSRNVVHVEVLLSRRQEFFVE